MTIMYKLSDSDNAKLCFQRVANRKSVRWRPRNEFIIGDIVSVASKNETPKSIQGLISICELPC